MKNLFKLAGSLFHAKSENGEHSGIVSIIKEKTGKISFRRSIPILILTTLVAPDVAVNGLTMINLLYTVTAGAIYVLPNLLRKD